VWRASIEINLALIPLLENGAYRQIYGKWFGIPWRDPN